MVTKIGAELQSALDATAHSDGRKMIGHHQEPSVNRHVSLSPSRDAVKLVVDTMILRILWTTIKSSWIFIETIQIGRMLIPDQAKSASFDALFGSRGALLPARNGFADA